MTAGIYAIRDAKSSVVYVGQSRDVDRRFRQHAWFFGFRQRTMWPAKPYLCEVLQNAWDRGQVVFEVIEDEVPRQQLASVEQRWIRTYVEAGQPIINRRGRW